MQIFKRLKLLMTYPDEIDQVLKKLRDEEEARIREENRHRLKLCYKHRQEQNHSHYSEHNCDYCKALKKINELNSDYESVA